MLKGKLLISKSTFHFLVKMGKIEVKLDLYFSVYQIQIVDISIPKLANLQTWSNEMSFTKTNFHRTCVLWHYCIYRINRWWPNCILLWVLCSCPHRFICCNWFSWDNSNNNIVACICDIACMQKLTVVMWQWNHQ